MRRDEAVNFVLLERNHSYIAATKDADFLHQKWRGKAAGIVCYRVAHSTRAAQHYKTVPSAPKMTDVRRCRGRPVRGAERLKCPRHDPSDDPRCDDPPRRDSSIYTHLPARERTWPPRPLGSWGGRRETDQRQDPTQRA